MIDRLRLALNYAYLYSMRRHACQNRCACRCPLNGSPCLSVPCPCAFLRSPYGHPQDMYHATVSFTLSDVATRCQTLPGMSTTTRKTISLQLGMLAFCFLAIHMNTDALLLAASIPLITLISIARKVTKNAGLRFVAEGKYGSVFRCDNSWLNSLAERTEDDCIPKVIKVAK